ncbi:MAG: iron export ABC transporter permease subunit FetB [Sandaracinaceae bacterium]
MTGAREVDALHLALAGAYLALVGFTSLILRLGMAGRLATAAGRMVVQLLAVGYVLGVVFAWRHAGMIALLALVMVLAAARAAIARSERRVPGLYAGAFLVLLLVGTVTTVGATAGVVQVDPWWTPQYLIPILGMVLGNALTGISLSVDTILATLDAKRDRIEARLALGASRWEAGEEAVRDAVRRGLIPILNAMTVAGIVSLPGMMTGQILEGADPEAAVRYQIMIFFLIAGATALGCLLLTLFAFWRCVNERHQLRAERIRRP